MNLSRPTLELCAQLLASAVVSGSPGTPDFDAAVEQVLGARREVDEALAPVSANGSTAH